MAVSVKKLIDDLELEVLAEGKEDIEISVNGYKQTRITISRVL